ncbi:MAG: pullulanase-type alpha-1,6-glucosidase [Propionicimonas sp.]
MFHAEVPELAKARGHWLRRDLIAWPADDLPVGLSPDSVEWRLHWSSDGPIDPREPEPVPWSTAGLALDPDGLPPAIAAQCPHLAGHLALRLDPAQVPAEQALRGQVVLSIHLHSGRLVTAGSLQVPHVIDQVYAAAARATLGVTWCAGVPSLRLWAPTAQRVRLLLWPAGASLHDPPAGHVMARDSDGVWLATGAPDWLAARYLFEVTVYTPHHRRVVSNRVTDPYSTALTVNSTHSVIVDLDAPELVVPGWVAAPSPALPHPVDQVIYELHVRDFSISDKSVPPQLRGTFLAFTADSAGMAHLRGLAQAGLTSVQLLPVFDNASVEEHPDQQTLPPKHRLKEFPPDSDQQQREVLATATVNGYNWGYDPWHYLASEGSFSSSLETAEGAGRVTEFRAMVGALHAAGLRVVLDMVFNHTASSGQDTKSVLDRIVPGYYHRLTPCGEVETSTCCANVATEHLMAEKLMVDACLSWARHYRVDGFRFDLMGHHTRANMLAVRAALDALTPQRDGLDGRDLTLYGEGWNFGEVAFNARFVQATQGQLGGTGIATFNDRLRDAVRGGGWNADPRVQGFGTGLVTAWNGTVPELNVTGSGERLAHETDLIQLGLAGNLRSFRFGSNSLRRQVRGDELKYGWYEAGYADQPDEVINYVDAHDNETLFDALTLKLHPATPMAERVRLNTVCLALATLGQSPVLWHAGTDLLRSKSLDRNSFNSGDWFNFLDFSGIDNGFAAGLPPERDNGPNWHILRPLLADPGLKPAPADIAFAHELALDLLRLRASSRLFRLRTAAAIRASVSFPVSNTWQQVPGVIVMRIGATGEAAADEPRWRSLVTIFNATPRLVHQGVPGPSSGYQLHPVQVAGCDDIVRGCEIGERGFWVPARTVAVFIEPH